MLNETKNTVNYFAKEKQFYASPNQAVKTNLLYDEFYYGKIDTLFNRDGTYRVFLVQLHTSTATPNPWECKLITIGPIIHLCLYKNYFHPVLTF